MDRETVETLGISADALSQEPRRLRSIFSVKGKPNTSHILGSKESQFSSF